jgi:hypothetical protein
MPHELSSRDRSNQLTGGSSPRYLVPDGDCQASSAIRTTSGSKRGTDLATWPIAIATTGVVISGVGYVASCYRWE